MAIELKLPKQPVTVTEQKPKTETDRKEDLVAVVQLNVTAEVIPDVLNQVCYGMHNGFKDFLYDKQGQLRSEQLTEMKFDSTFKEHRIILAHNELKDLDLKDVVIRGFHAVPQTDGRVALSFTLKLKPTMDGMHYITDGLISDSWTLEIFGAVQGDLLGDAQSNEEQDEAEAA